MRFSHVRDRSLANTWFKVAVRHLKIRNPKIRVSFTLRTIFKILKQLLRAFIRVSDSFIDLDAHFKPLTHEFNQ